MPFVNEHAARQTDPAQYDSFARKELAPGITAILGVKDGKTEVQSVRFDATKFEPEQAKKWLEEHDMKATVEAAVKKQIKLIVLNKVSWGVELGYALDSARPREGGNIIPLNICKSTLPLDIGNVVIVEPKSVTIKKIKDRYGIDGEFEIISKGEGKPSSAREILQESFELIEKSELKEEALQALKLKQSVPVPEVQALGVVLKRDFPLIKDDHKQLIYGVVYEPFDGVNVDAHGDYATAQEIEKTAHNFLEQFNEVSYMHEKRINQDAKVVESFIAPCDYTQGTERIKKGSWVMVTHVLNKELWGQVLKGEIDAYSIEGVGMAGEDLIQKSANGAITKRNLINMTIDAVALVDKGANKKRFYLVKKEEPMPEKIEVSKALDEATLAQVVEAVMAKLKEATQAPEPEEVIEEACKPKDEVKKAEAVAEPAKVDDKPIVKDAAYYISNPEEDIPDSIIPEVLNQMSLKGE